MRAHVGPLDTVDGLPQAARLLERAWELVGPAVANQQVKEFVRARDQGRLPRSRLHPWTAGLAWHREHVNKGFTGMPPREALYVLQDILALERIPGLFPTHERKVIHRIRDEREAALAEIRVAAQYAPAGIVAEWSAVTHEVPGAPDVWIPAHRAEIEMKWLQPRDAIAEDLESVFKVMDDAWEQIDKRASAREPGPAAIYIALPNATSLRAWSTDQRFQGSLGERFTHPAYAIVSAIVFVTEPVIEVNGTTVLYGSPAWPVKNERAAKPWPPHLPLSTNRETG